ncbi:MAG: hypothetical protein GX256_08370, partial [Fretibacterium sp.]|nr:hypothetical protein [Fretibacterium sp.]
MRRKFFNTTRVMIAFATLLIALSPAMAATKYWTGAAGDGSWTTPGNWSDHEDLSSPASKYPGEEDVVDTVVFDDALSITVTVSKDIKAPGVKIKVKDDTEVTLRKDTTSPYGGVVFLASGDQTIPSLAIGKNATLRTAFLPPLQDFFPLLLPVNYADVEIELDEGSRLELDASVNVTHEGTLTINSKPGSVISGDQGFIFASDATLVLSGDTMLEGPNKIITALHKGKILASGTVTVNDPKAFTDQYGFTFEGLNNHHTDILKLGVTQKLEKYFYPGGLITIKNATLDVSAIPHGELVTTGSNGPGYKTIIMDEDSRLLFKMPDLPTSNPFVTFGGLLVINNPSKFTMACEKPYKDWGITTVPQAFTLVKALYSLLSNLEAASSTLLTAADAAKITYLAGGQPLMVGTAVSDDPTVATAEGRAIKLTALTTPLDVDVTPKPGIDDIVVDMTSGSPVPAFKELLTVTASKDVSPDVKFNPPLPAGMTPVFMGLTPDGSGNYVTTLKINFGVLTANGPLYSGDATVCYDATIKTSPIAPVPFKVTVKGVSTGGGETPGGETPGGETPGGETPGGETPGGETPGGETPGGETP